MRILGLIVVLAVVAVGGAWMFHGTLIKSGIETFGSKLAGTAVTVDKIQVSLLNGHAVVEGLAVANPEGFTAGNAVSLGKAEIKLVPASLLSDKIRIESVLLDGTAITYEMNEKGTNIDAIMANVKKITGAGATVANTPATPSTPAENSATPAKGKDVQIDRVVISNTKATMSASLLGKGGQQSFTVPEIVIKDIGATKSVSLGEAVQSIFTPIMGSVTAMSPADLTKVKESMTGIKDDITTGLKGIGSSIKNMFGQ